jgi:hypothetical protein
MQKGGEIMIIKFERAHHYHASIRQVLTLALEKAVLAGALNVQRAHEIEEGARTRCDCGEVRRLTEQVLLVWKEHTRQDRALPRPGA